MFRLASPVSMLGAGFLSLIIFLTTYAAPVQAAFELGPAEVGTITYYQPFRDEYRSDFGMPPPSMWDIFRVYFESPENVPFSKDYTYNDVKSRIMYLTCNGTYQFQFYSGPTLVAWSGLINTTQIINPPCDSYPDGGANDDLNATYGDNPGGGYDVSFDGIPGAATYEIWDQGNLIDTIPAGSGGPYDFNTSGGSLTIVAKDGSGEIVGMSDIQVPEYEGWEGEPGGNGCDVCKKLADVLQCPGWDDYMGELQQMIVNALGEYFGNVPAIPNTENIETEIVPELPDIDTSFEDAENLVPDVPAGYESPLSFDITSGPQITVTDDSAAITIEEPDAHIDADDPGVMVFPGDSRNSSDGIKEPDEWQSPYPTPEPTPPTNDPPPDVEMPEPDFEPSDLPEPDYMGGTGPNPSI